MKRVVIISLLILFVSQFIYAQPNKKKIEYKSGVLYTSEELGPEIKILVDSVEFMHENAKMFCDSALFNPTDNYFEAFGRIKVVKPTEDRDTVFLYGDTLRYDGDKKLASVRNRVSLLNDSLELYTDNLDYDLQKDLGYYFDDGITINGKDTLSSTYGYYYATKKEFFFKDNVIINNPKFEMYSDTLKHNTDKHITYFFGPSKIFSEENYIYCEDGWYDHDKHLSQFRKNALLRNGEQVLKGQTIFYDRNKGIGRARDKVEIKDSTRNIILRGNYGYYDETSDYSLITDSAVFIRILEVDSLYMHADTIESLYAEVSEQQAKADGLPQRFRVVQAYNHTKLFKSNFQAKCDSLVYTFRDSVMEMYGKPVLWSDNNQITADFIYVLTAGKEVQQINMEKNAFIISQSDSVRFNQIKGDRMIGLAENRELVQINVYENGESLYFLKDEDEKLIGSNHISCKDMNIFLKNQKLDKIWFYEKPTSVLKPPNSLSDSQKKLTGFRWEEKHRPKNPRDIFTNTDEDKPSKNETDKKINE